MKSEHVRQSTIMVTVVGAWIAAEVISTEQVVFATVYQGIQQRNVESHVQWETLAQVEAYINSVGTMQARFLQVTTEMHVTKGTIFLAQPGRMRLEYDPPSPVLLIANGWHLIYHDMKLEQTSYIRLNATPAGVMLQTPAHMKDDVTVTHILRVPGSVVVGLIWINDPSAGEVSLLFGERPFFIKQWCVKDMQGMIVTVSLYDVRTECTLDPDLFRFTDPDFSLN